MFEEANLRESRNVLVDWILRAAIGVAFVAFGMEKFSSGPDSPWVRLFQEIGAGQWFRIFTGAVEVLGGVLVVIPWTATIGLALLAATMASAVILLVFVVGRPGDSFVAAGFCIGLVVFWWNRRDR